MSLKLILAAAAAVILSACAGTPVQPKGDIVAGGASVRLNKAEATTYKGLATQSWVKDEDNKSKSE
jgi:hypothetical protein